MKYQKKIVSLQQISRKMANYLDDLNESQRLAVLCTDHPALVIAGAGSGKTRVLTYKIAHILETGVRANRILALTFTNKAAREMKERIARVVGAETARYLWMGTFHSIATRILRMEAEYIGFTRDFSIYDTQDSKSLIKQIIKELQVDEKIYKPNVVLGRISDAKNVLMTDEQYMRDEKVQQRDRFDRLYKMGELYHQYQLRLRAANAMDFDDLLVNLCYLFRDNPDILAKYQEMFEYVLVDEYQDTNYAQYLLVKNLAAPQNCVTVVGDDAQSIYSFRGADIRNILTFQNGYPNAELFKLERNYRSTQTIVKAANSLIHKNEHQIFKEVYSEKQEGERLQLMPFVSDLEEGSGIARLVQEDHRVRGYSYDDIAILYRTNAQSRNFENELRKQNIPYRIYGGTSFYQRKEIKDAVAYFRLCLNPKDNEALLRVINFPARGIGDTTMTKVSDRAIECKVSIFDIVSHPMEAALNVSSGIQKKLMQFAALIEDLRQDMEVKNAAEFADEVLKRTNILTAAALDTTPEGIDRKQNLDELLNYVNTFVAMRQEEGIDFTPIADFMSEISLQTDQDQHSEDHSPRVTLMTVHAAKGLEFPVVYVVGLEENLFPSQFCQSKTEIEEERRLLYVAITRAMERCSLSYAGQRYKNGAPTFSSPSRFLQDIDRHFLQNVAAPAPRKPQWSGRSAWDDDDYIVDKPKLPTSTPKISLGMRKASGRVAVQGDYVKGERVMHRVFGEGTVLDVYNENDNDKIDILFDKVGKKTLLLSFAKLEKNG